MPKKSVEQTTGSEVAAEKPKRNRVSRPPLLLPGQYRALRVYSGNNPGAQCSMLEDMIYDDFRDASWNDIERQLRTRYPKQDIHVKCLGGPRRVDWYIPRKIRIATGDDLVAGMEQIGQLSERLVELEHENKILKQQIEEGGPLDDEEEDYDEDDEEEESSVFSFFKDLYVEHKPEIKELIVAVTKKINQSLPMSQQQEPIAQHQHPFADEQPISAEQQGIDDSEDYDIPSIILDYLEQIDWTRTNPKKLLGMALVYEDKFAENGIFFKQHRS
jgi:hypothetical protein